MDGTAATALPPEDETVPSWARPRARAIRLYAAFTRGVTRGPAPLARAFVAAAVVARPAAPGAPRAPVVRAIRATARAARTGDEARGAARARHRDRARGDGHGRDLVVRAPSAGRASV